MGFGGIAGRLLSMGLGVALMIEGGTAQTVTGPIAGNPTLSQGAFSKAPAGYLIQEFFLSGSAAAYGLSDERSEEHTSELQSLMRISYAVFCLNQKNTQRWMASEDKAKG